MERLRSQNMKLHQYNMERTALIGTLKKKCSDQEKKISELSSSVLRIRNYKRANDRLIGEKRKLAEDNNLKSGQIIELKKIRDKDNETIKELQKKTSNLNKVLLEAQEVVTKSKEEFSVILEENAKLEKDLKNLQESEKMAQKNLIDMKAKYAKVSIENSKLCEIDRSTQEKVDQLEKKVKDLESATVKNKQRNESSFPTNLDITAMDSKVLECEKIINNLKQENLKLKIKCCPLNVSKYQHSTKKEIAEIIIEHCLENNLNISQMELDKLTQSEFDRILPKLSLK